jgi:predicted DCC family thiol-disulfide oxidoreductase YuxK
MRRAAILYDEDCAFCKWSLAKILAWDRGGRLRPVALQDPEADLLLKSMDGERKMASWHLVTPDGRVHSAGAAAEPLFRLLPAGKPLALIARAFPKTTDRVYRWVAANRTPIGRRLGVAPGSRGACRIDDRG